MTYTCLLAQLSCSHRDNHSVGADDGPNLGTRGVDAAGGGSGARASASGAPPGWRSRERIPILVTSLHESWAVRFDAGYILDQAVFAPFPEALVTEADSGKGRSGRG